MAGSVDPCVSIVWPQLLQSRHQTEQTGLFKKIAEGHEGKAASPQGGKDNKYKFLSPLLLQRQGQIYRLEPAWILV